MVCLRHTYCKYYIKNAVNKKSCLGTNKFSWDCSSNLVLGECGYNCCELFKYDEVNYDSCMVFMRVIHRLV